ncbi:hypothetical protein [Microbulbifer sp. DLAB2-AA]|uniref:hypothetical protein n=1 Tax=Microbulbifer sp. DLAB2-AA TaxID=3243394 RepID=UPI00403A4A09
MNIKFGNLGIVFGGLALMLALVHFWGGPFSPQPTMETVVAEKAASLRQAAIDALSGKKVVETTYRKKIDADSIINIVTAILGGIALILGVVSFTQKEPTRVAGGAAILGVSAIAFQFIAMAVMVLLAILLISAVLSSIGVG